MNSTFLAAEKTTHPATFWVFCGSQRWHATHTASIILRTDMRPF